VLLDVERTKEEGKLFAAVLRFFRFLFLCIVVVCLFHITTDRGKFQVRLYWLLMLFVVVAVMVIVVVVVVVVVVVGWWLFVVCLFVCTFC
jgi:hypothetical protein